MWQSRRQGFVFSLINPFRAGWCLLFAVLLPLAPAYGQAKELHLSKIDVIGLRRLKPDEVITTSGLEVGQVVDNGIIDAAAQKLVDSGLFKRLSYHVHTTADQLEVTFDVEENLRFLNISFDNFVWFNDAEIYTALRKDLPNFVGSIPEGGDMAEKVAAALQRLLNARGIPGQVEFAPYADEHGKQEIVFRVKGKKISICALSFPGAAAIPEADLIKASESLIGADYSRKDLSLFGPYTLAQLYRRLGHLAVKFEDPVATVDTTGHASCPNGVEVAIAVDEGIAYSWDKAEWVGNQVLSAADLNKALDMNSGDLADGVKIDKGLHAVQQAYARKGYLAANVKTAFTFDDATQKVTDRFTIKEGPQFHMGTLTINGLSEDDTRRLKDRWHLAAGALFEMDYLNNFLTSEIKDFLNQSPVLSGLPLKITHELKPDLRKQTVDVIITLK